MGVNNGIGNTLELGELQAGSQVGARKSLFLRISLLIVWDPSLCIRDRLMI